MSIFNWFKKNKNDDFVNTNINKADIHSTTISNTDIKKTKKRPVPKPVPLENNPDLALKLLNMEDRADSKTSNAEKRVLRDIESNCKSWQERLNKAIEICGEPNTAKQRYVYAIAHITNTLLVKPATSLLSSSTKHNICLVYIIV